VLNSDGSFAFVQLQHAAVITHDEVDGADADIAPPAFDALVAVHQFPCAQEYLYHNIDIGA